MPIERRDVLFYFPELKLALGRLRDADALGVLSLPQDFDDSIIIEALHTRDASYEFHDRRTRMLSRVDPSDLKGDGTVFRARKHASFGRSKEFFFFVPDQVMREALAAECAGRGIVLPVSAQKEIFVDTLRIGLRIHLDDTGLDIEEEDAMTAV